MRIPDRLIDPNEEFNTLSQTTVDNRPSGSEITEIVDFDLRLARKSIPAIGVIRFHPAEPFFLGHPECVSSRFYLLPSGYYPNNSWWGPLLDTRFEVQVPRGYNPSIFRDSLYVQIKFPLTYTGTVATYNSEATSTFIAKGRPRRQEKDYQHRVIAFNPFVMISPAIVYHPNSRLYLPKDYDILMKKATAKVIVKDQDPLFDEIDEMFPKLVKLL